MDWVISFDGLIDFKSDGETAKIAGHRIRVMDVAYYYESGATVEDLQNIFPDLHREQIETALGFYYLNRQQMSEQMIDFKNMAECLRNKIEGKELRKKLQEQSEKRND